MKPHFKQIVTIILSVFLLSCSSDETTPTTSPPVVTPPKTTEPPIASKVNYLALGDSYTIGQSVCATCRFPEQLKASLNAMYSSSISLKIIATTGWTTSNLISAIDSQNPESNYDLVTLLIGVNNQFQHRSFSIYEKEFPELVNKAIMLAKGDRKNVVVISIPDYAYTPYGQALAGNQSGTISTEINQYNAFAEKYCNNNQIAFVSITEITREGLNSPILVASDGLHPSEAAYRMFVDKMMPKVKIALQD
ncbi:SGNH/GDSL hydrolase family protein [Flavobacterium sp. CFBP9031]|uniref:SGNH/GDSL hydrolase family protein n=1 Tax=Flavobacterium sp. CFBP9031 TaxID=3096538 RepID=UPI002A6AC4FF|nr:SGNH/GDSL hydrolase family protein [Flavobacterium sp. CFBP9031]MDY0989271.1 SGNH/GDSL hydrolase family protein [Flavobacterium sp. CFBP9031]